MLVTFVDPASECPILCGYSQCWSLLWIQPVLVLLVDTATSYGSLCGSSQCNSLSASSQRWSPLWIQPLLVPLVDRASDCPLCRSSQCSFLVHPASAGPLIVCSRCWSPHSVYAATAGPLVDPASDCPLCGSSQCNSLSASSQRWSPLWIQPLLVPLVDPASDCPLCGSSQCSLMLY